MCWVMPPASPATTLAWRMASSNDVLPWSTWPMIVTIGGRGTGAPSSSGRSNRPSSTSDSATRLTEWPISSATSSAESATVALLSAARRTRRRDDDLLSRQDQRRTPGDPPPFILLAAGCAGERCGRGDPRGDPRHGLGRARDRRGRHRFAAGKTPSRLVFRLTLEIGFLSAAKFLLALARFGGLAFEAVARLALAPRLGLGLLTAAIPLLARASIKKSPVARLALL